MEAGTIALLAFLAGILLIGFFALKDWWKQRPDFTYRKVKVWLIDSPASKIEAKALVQQAYQKLKDPTLYGKFAFKKPKKTKELVSHLKKGIDSIEDRLGWKPEDEGLSLRVQAYPIVHYHPTAGWYKAHGEYQSHKKMGYICVMPEERGGLPATASLIPHEIGGHHHKRFKSGPYDYKSDVEHTDTEFWEKLDSQEGL